MVSLASSPHDCDFPPLVGIRQDFSWTAGWKSAYTQNFSADLNSATYTNFSHFDTVPKDGGRGPNSLTSCGGDPSGVEFCKVMTSTTVYCVIE